MKDRFSLIHAADWLPTLYKAAGGNPSDLGQIDGVDQWVSLKRREEPSQRSEMLYNINPYPKNGAEYPSAAIRCRMQTFENVRS